MKKNKFWFLSIITSLLLPSVLAQTAPGSFRQGLVGDLIQRAAYTLEDILTYTITIAHPYPIGNYQEEVPIWALLLMFTLVFAVVYAASGTIGIFKENKGPRKAFCAAVAGITIFGTPITEMLIITFAGYFTTLASLLMLVGFIIGIWFIIFVLPSRTGGMSKWGAEGSKLRAEGKQMRAEARKMSDDAYIEKKSSKRSKRAFNKLRRFLWWRKRLTGDLKNRLNSIRQKLIEVEKIHDSPSGVLEAKNIILRELRDVIPIIDKEMRIDDKSAVILQRIKQLQQTAVSALLKGAKNEQDIERIVEQEKAKLGKDVKNLDVSGMRQYFSAIFRDEKVLISLRQRITQIEAAFKKVDIDIRALIEKAMQMVGGNRLDQAILAIDEIVRLIEQEDALITEVLGMEQQINALTNRDYKLENFVKRKEKKVVTSEKKDEAMIARELGAGRV